MRFLNFLLPVGSFLLSTSSPSLVSAQQPQIFHNPKNKPAKYAYLGCYNETTGLPNTSGERALYGGINLVEPDTLTVEKCWEFCAKNNSAVEYKYAGLEYARECWCSTTLNSLSAKMDDSECNLACEGNQTQVCGGNLRLTVYMAGAAAAAGRQVAMMGLMTGAVMLGMMGVSSGLV